MCFRSHLLVLALLLAGCSHPISISVQDSPLVLRGKWKASTSLIRNVHALAVDAKREVLLESSSSGFFVRNPLTGKVLRSVKNPAWLGQVHYRADDRLVSSNGMKTFVVHPETLEVERTFDFGGTVSRDGTRVLVGREVYDTFSGAHTGGYNPDPHDEIHALSEKGNYGLVVSKLVRLDSRSVVRQLRTEGSCSSSEDNLPLVLSEDPESDRVAVGYRDHRVQVLDGKQGQVLFTGDLYGCTRGNLRIALRGDVLAYLTANQWGTYNLKTKQHLYHLEKPSVSITAAAWDGQRWYQGGMAQVRAVDPQGVIWKDDSEAHWTSETLPFSLNTTTTQQNQAQYLFQGEARWGEDVLQVQGTGTGHLVEFKQAAPSKLWADGSLIWEGGTTSGGLSCQMVFSAESLPEHPEYSCVFQKGGRFYQGKLQKQP